MPITPHSTEPLSAREMVRAHTYPLLAVISTLALVAIAVLQIPSAVRNHRFNRCVEHQQQLRQHSGTMHGQEGPGKLIYLLAVQHCLGR